MKESKTFAWLAGVFLVAFYLPLGNEKGKRAILVQDYRHVSVENAQ